MGITAPAGSTFPLPLPLVTEICRRNYPETKAMYDARQRLMRKEDMYELEEYDWLIRSEE